MNTQIRILKALPLCLTAILLVNVTAAAEPKPVFKPGVMLKLYELKPKADAKVVQDGEPLFETVDRSGEFRVANFRNREGIDLPKGKPVAAKWEGYLKVEKAGSYLFMAGPKTSYTTLIILINNERLLLGTKIRNPETASIDLSPGLHQIKLWLVGSHGSEKASASVQWRHKDDKDSWKELKPGSLFYRE